MIKHIIYPEAELLVKHKMAVLLTGEKGSGKTTIAMQIAEGLGLDFYSLSMTRQTTLSHLIGFINVTGGYVESQLYSAATKGGVFLLDEIDAGDPNVLLALNTIENGFISFPTGVVQIHEDFRLLATANPQDQHEFYVGRSKLDAATLDRFDIIHVDTDSNLETKLVSFNTYQHITAMRKVLAEQNSTTHVSMRDSLKFQLRKELGIEGSFVARILKSETLLSNYYKLVESLPAFNDQADCKTIDDLYSLMMAQAIY